MYWKYLTITKYQAQQIVKVKQGYPLPVRLGIFWIKILNLNSEAEASLPK